MQALSLSEVLTKHRPSSVAPRQLMHQMALLFHDDLLHDDLLRIISAL